MVMDITAMYIVLGVLFILLFLLFLPVGLTFYADGKFTAKIKYAGIKVYEFDSEKQEKKKKKTSGSNKKSENKEDTPDKSVLKSVFKEKGFAGGLKTICHLLKEVLSSVFGLLRHFKGKNFDLSVTVASDNAATTAIEYGTVCAALYPLLELLFSAIDFKDKRVDVSSDFGCTNPDLKFDAQMSVKLIFCLTHIVSILKTYQKLKKG